MNGWIGDMTKLRTAFRPFAKPAYQRPSRSASVSKPKLRSRLTQRASSFLATPSRSFSSVTSPGVGYAPSTLKPMATMMSSARSFFQFFSPIPNDPRRRRVRSRRFTGNDCGIVRLTMRRWGRFAAAYTGMALVAVLIAIATRGRAPFSLPHPWLPLPAPRDVLYSVALGSTLGTLLAIGTRFSVPRFAWAKNLHLELRPFAKDVR